MEYLKLIGILIVIIGFALKFDSILIIMAASIVTALVGGLGLEGFLEVFGKTFVANRTMAIFILVLLVTGTLERNGLKEAAANLIGKFKVATPGIIISIYGAIRGFFGAFNVGIGGLAGFIRPVLLPMATGSIENKGHKVNEEHLDQIKGMSAGVENITWFFFQVLFLNGSGNLLVQTTLESLGYNVELIDLVKVEIPIAIIALSVTVIYYILKDNKAIERYYK